MAVKEKTILHLNPRVCHIEYLNHLRPSLCYDGGDFKQWRRKLRRKLMELLGLDLTVDRIDLNVRRLWKRNVQSGVIEKIAFSSEPGSDVPAYVCLPADSTPPYTWVICLQGHSTGMHNSIAVSRHSEKEKIKVPGDRDFAIGCMERGLAALCIEQRSLGQRAEFYQKKRTKDGCHQAVMRSLMLGKTLIGERVFDVDRAIDYLYSRDDVDRNKIGVMGNSGGGTVSIYAAAMLSRIQFAMPSCAFCTFKDSIFSICHCGCNYIPRISTVCDMADILGLFAPKPVLVVAGAQDEIFPIGGVKKAYRDLHTIYKAAGVGGNCKLVIGKEGHRFYAEQAWRAMLKLIGER